MGISFQELILLLMIGLIVLGPERLPRVANQLGSWLGQARRMTRVMKRQLEEELNLDRQYDMLPPARTRHSTPGSYAPPTGAAADTAAAASSDASSDATDDAEQDDTFSPAHGSDEVGTGVGDRLEEPADDRPDAVAGPTGDDAAAGPASDASAAEAVEPADDKADSKKP